QAGERQPPEAERPGRHFGRRPLGRDIDAGRKQPAENGGGVGRGRRRVSRRPRRGGHGNRHRVHGRPLKRTASSYSDGSVLPSGSEPGPAKIFCAAIAPLPTKTLKSAPPPPLVVAISGLAIFSRRLNS